METPSFASLSEKCQRHTGRAGHGCRAEAHLVSHHLNNSPHYPYSLYKLGISCEVCEFSALDGRNKHTWAIFPVLCLIFFLIAEIKMALVQITTAKHADTLETKHICPQGSGEWWWRPPFLYWLSLWCPGTQGSSWLGSVSEERSVWEEMTPSMAGMELQRVENSGSACMPVLLDQRNPVFSPRLQLHVWMGPWDWGSRWSVSIWTIHERIPFLTRLIENKNYP